MPVFRKPTADDKKKIAELLNDVGTDAVAEIEGLAPAASAVAPVTTKRADKPRTCPVCGSAVEASTCPVDGWNPDESPKGAA